MPILEIITIGTELLLGEITDTNSTYIARTLRDHGIDIYRITTIGDNPKRIASTIKEALKRADIIITTGGLGPTVDDPTRQAVADAADRDLVFRPELWSQILDRFKRFNRKPTVNNRQQAYIPEGAIPIENDVGTAPCFIVEFNNACVISLPGVPKEMEHILHKHIIPYLHDRYTLMTQIIKATVLHAASLGESAIDEIIADLEEQANPTVGLLAHPGQVDIRVTAKALSEAEAIALSQPIIQELESRLGDTIYGRDEETLESKIFEILIKNQRDLILVESGLGGTMIQRIKNSLYKGVHTYMLTEEPNDIEDFENKMKELHLSTPQKIHFGAALIPNEHAAVHFVFIDSGKIQSATRFYGGPPEYIPLWAQNTGLDFLRKKLNERIGNK
jgi:competence/damage-inducible protein CinA-like protein